MRNAIALGLLLAGMATAASAMPLGTLPTSTPIVQVQLRCSPSSCVDPSTGAYTQSTCDRRGCRPVGGVVGQVGPNGEDIRFGRRRGYDDGYDRPRRRGWDDDGYRGGGGGGFDCNASRCIEAGTGRVWESSCDRRGCRPLRPSRRQY